MKTVSVILTTYNSEAHIKAVLESILGQTGAGSEFELDLIVADDCSTDATAEILKNYPIRYFKTDTNTGGPNRGRNMALKRTTGDVICIADHDDIWEKQKILALLPHTEQVPIVSSGYTLIDQSAGKTIRRVAVSEDACIHYPANETFLNRLSRSKKGQHTYLGSMMFRSELKHILFEEFFGMLDFDWILRMYHQRPSVEVCDSLYTRHTASGNLSLNESYRIKDFYFSLMQIESYESEYPGEVKKAYKRIHGSRARYYYLTGNMRKARFFFRKSEWNLVTLAYYLSTFAGAAWVRRKFKVFG